MPSNNSVERINNTLNFLVNGLIQKGFTFVTLEYTPEQMREQLAAFDEGRLSLTSKVFGFVLGSTDIPDFAKMISKNIVGFGADEVQDMELATLQDLMRTHFPMCAVTFSKLWGPRFIPIINGDDFAQQEFFDLLDHFQQINLYMLALGGRLQIRLFGKALVGLNSSAATGSLIVITSTTERAYVLRQWIKSQPMHSDTIINQAKERFTKWQFWAKFVFGMVEYKPHQLRQEAIVIDAQTGLATSNASPRMGFEFGFSLEEIAKGIG